MPTSTTPLRQHAELGVLAPIVAVRTGEGALRVRYGHRGRLLEADVQLHEAVARASGNRFLTVSDQVVHDSVSTLIREDVADRSLRWHSRILEAIAERDGPAPT